MTEQAPPAASDADQAVVVEPSEPSEPVEPAEPPPPSTSAATPERRGSSGTALLGILLITVGVFFFIGQWLNIDWGAATWPFYVIAPGLAMMAFGLTQRDGSGLTVAGSIVTMGARKFVLPKIRHLVPFRIPLGDISRPERSRPAEGYPAAHAAEQARIVHEALTS